jgi:hypothetical protein
LLTTAEAVVGSIKDYFSTRQYAPSESPTANLEMAEERRLRDAAALTTADPAQRDPSTPDG